MPDLTLSLRQEAEVVTDLARGRTVSQIAARRHLPTGVVTAVAELQDQVRAAETDGGEMPGPLRAEEVDLLARVDPDTARTVQRTGGGRADWTHRRPERAAVQPVPGRQLGRTVDGSD